MVTGDCGSGLAKHLAYWMALSELCSEKITHAWLLIFGGASFKEFV